MTVRPVRTPSTSAREGCARTPLLPAMTRPSITAQTAVNTIRPRVLRSMLSMTSTAIRTREKIPRLMRLSDRWAGASGHLVDRAEVALDEGDHLAQDAVLGATQPAPVQLRRLGLCG